MIVRILLLGLVLSTFCNNLWASDTSDSVRDRLADTLLSEIGEKVIGELEQQGLSRTDAEPVAEALAQDSATCFVDAVEKLAIENGLDPDELLPKFEATITSDIQSDLGADIDSERLAYETEACLLTALENAGIDAR